MNRRSHSQVREGSANAVVKNRTADYYNRYSLSVSIKRLLQLLSKSRITRYGDLSGVVSILLKVSFVCWTNIKSNSWRGGDKVTGDKDQGIRVCLSEGFVNFHEGVDSSTEHRGMLFSDHWNQERRVGYDGGKDERHISR